MIDNADYGVVFDIKRFALHDGEGIRSTLFTKGCPLKCPWCHNPEGRQKDTSLMWFETLCIGCGACVDVCTEKALTCDKSRINVDREKCIKCGKCVAACPALAIKFDGWRMHYEEVFEELKKDLIFFQGSGGGITLSGGDPLVQSEFNLKLLRLCKENGISTTIETCLYADQRTVLSFAELVDHFYIDIKILDDEKHKEIVGVSNRVILDNFEELVRRGADICIRIPLIPGFTDSDDNISSIARYVKVVGDSVRLELLNYNPLAINKYISLQEEYIIPEDAQPLSSEEMERKNKLVADIMERN